MHPSWLCTCRLCFTIYPCGFVWGHPVSCSTLSLLLQQCKSFTALVRMLLKTWRVLPQSCCGFVCRQLFYVCYLLNVTLQSRIWCMFGGVVMAQQLPSQGLTVRLGPLASLHAPNLLRADCPLLEAA
jgi:hypothetical protein